MKNRDLNRYPSPEELYALVRAIHATRAAEMARSALRALRHLFEAKGWRHA